MTTVIVGGKQVKLSPRMVIGKGGEADVYDLGNGTVLKMFKRRDDPDYTGNPHAQQGAVLRIQEHQKKLPAFPKGLPSAVVAPLELAHNKAGEVVGYTMKYLEGQEVLLRFGDRQYREQGGIDGNQVIGIFRDLHGLVRSVHDAQVVIGDFNDLNVLVDDQGKVCLVDADSMQFATYPCRTFTARFVDPLNCGPDDLILQRPHSAESDWYAFNTMLIQSLLYVGPYGGVHKPKGGKRLQHDKRVLARVTVFDGDVIYPKPAIPFGALPDELLEHFQRVYARDERGVFPEHILAAMRWTTCTNCGAIHARATCPGCAAPGIVKEVTVRRGNVTASRVFRTKGQIMHTVFQHGTLRYLYHEDGAFRREGDVVVTHGNLDPEFRFRIQGDSTLIGKHQRLIVLSPDGAPEQLSTGTVGKLSVFDANERHRFWLQGDQLVRDDTLGNTFIGNILSGRTLIWTGDRFGFGFYQAGGIVRGFTFNADGQSLNDRVALPGLPGQLIDASCVFSDSLAWFMVSLQDSGRIVNRCFVIDARGELLAEASATQDEDLWLGDGIRGHFAAGRSLFAATDEGIVKIDVDNGNLVVSQTFPDTEPFVDSGSNLLPGNGGIYVVTAKEITLLKIQ